jgi:hypothetical protein
MSGQPKEERVVAERGELEDRFRWSFHILRRLALREGLDPRVSDEDFFRKVQNFFDALHTRYPDALKILEPIVPTRMDLEEAVEHITDRSL